MKNVKAIVFDAYGTLLDVHGPSAQLADRIGPAFAEFSKLWRQKQLEYTWLRSLMRKHADFAQVTADALDYAMAAHGLHDKGLRADLLGLFEKLVAYPDAASTLQAIAARGLKTAILSNGSPKMLDAAVHSGGLQLDAVISVEAVGVYKPDPRVYELALERFRLSEPQEILFVSANPWDAQGASSFGFKVVRINRAEIADENLPGKPDHFVKSLTEIIALLG